MIKVKTISTKIKTGVRWVKVQIWGPGDVGEAPVVSPAGIDSSPIAGMQAIYGATSANGINNVIGYINTGALAEPGELRTYCTDGQGAVQSYMWHKVDGTTHINGDADYAVLFNALKTEFNELKGKYNDLANITTSLRTAMLSHTHPVPALGTSGVATPPPVINIPQQSAANIDNAKNERIKTND